MNRKRNSCKYFSIVIIFCLMIYMVSPSAVADEDDGYITVTPESEAADTPVGDTAGETAEEPVEEPAKPDTSNLEARLAALKQEAKKIQSELDSIGSEKKDAQATVNSITSKIKNLEEQIQIVDQQILALNNEITELEGQIEEKEEEIESKEEEIRGKEEEYRDSYERYKLRVRAVYMAGQASSLEVLLGSENFSDFFDNMEYLKAITDRDQSIMENLVNIRNQIEEDKLLIEEEKANIEDYKDTIASNREAEIAKKAEQEETRRELNSLKVQADTDLNTLAQQEKEVKYEMQITEKEMEQIQAEILRIINQNTTADSPYVGGVLQWPVPGYYKISCAYMGYPGHTGMDITGQGAGSINNAPFYAAGPGTVIAVVRGSTGYGHYVMVDHGGGIVTLYAHANSLVVSVGQSVDTSTQLGTVGSTGNTTGPHLHFEVRENGVHKNPYNYVTAG